MCDRACSCLSLNQRYLLATLRVAVQLDIPEPDMAHIWPVRENTQLITTDTDHVTVQSPESEVTCIFVRERHPPWWVSGTFSLSHESILLQFNRRMGKLCMQYKGGQCTITANLEGVNTVFLIHNSLGQTCDFTRPGQAVRVEAGEVVQGGFLATYGLTSLYIWGAGPGLDLLCWDWNLLITAQGSRFFMFLPSAIL